MRNKRGEYTLYYTVEKIKRGKTRKGKSRNNRGETKDNRPERKNRWKVMSALK